MLANDKNQIEEAKAFITFDAGKQVSFATTRRDDTTI